MEREVFSRLIEWDTDAQTIRQLIRTCHRNPAPAAESPSGGPSTAAPAEADQHVLASGNGSAAATPAEEQVAEVEAARAQADTVHKQVAVSVDVSSIPLREGADGGQETAAAATRPADLPTGDAAQSADKRRKAHSTAQRQLLDVLRPLAQRALLEAQRPAGVESVEEANVFA